MPKGYLKTFARSLSGGRWLPRLGRPAEPAWFSWRYILLLTVVFWGLFAGCIVVYLIVNSREINLMHGQASADGSGLAQEIQHHLNLHLQSVLRLRSAWMVGRLRSASDLAAASEALLADDPVFSSIAALDSDDICEWAAPAPNNRHLVETDFALDPHWQSALRRARENGAESITAVEFDQTGEPFVDIVVPLVPSDQRSPVLAVRMMLADFLRSAIAERFRRDFNIEIHDGTITKGAILIARFGDALDQKSGLADINIVQVGDRFWRVSLWPKQTSPISRVANLSRWILWAGIPIAFLATATLFWLILSRVRESLRLTRRHLAALESLNRLTTAIGAKLGSGTDMLRELSESARVLMAMDKSMVALLDSDGQSCTFFESAADAPPAQPRRVALDQLPLSRRAMALRRTMIISDPRETTLPGVRASMEAKGVAAAIVIPLFDAEQVGFLALGSVRPRRFDDADRRLIDLLGAHAGVILANNRLYEQVRTALEVREQLLQQQEKLYAASAAAYHAASFDRSVQAIVENAPQLLGVDMCMVNLIDSTSGQEMVVAASSGHYSELVVGLRFRIAGTNAQRIIESRQLIVIENARHDSTVHPLFRQLARVGSIMYVPMFRSDAQPLGMLSIVNHEPTDFSEAQRRLCQAFANRAAAAIENAELHEQTRRSAATQAVLLRELHHRVKNNLAGIVALLSIEQPELPPDARRWLDRAVQRIQNMARAHDLFSGRIEHVSLQQLVEQVVVSLSVVSRQVRIDTRLSGCDPKLPTTQAVSLAMVLHELCSNAILHGVEDSGSIIIQSRPCDEGLAIDVIDDGHGVPPDILTNPRRLGRDRRDDGGVATATQPRRGMGLVLVQELVKRELQGVFELRQRSGRGTIATVRFAVVPLKAEETL